MRRDLTFRNPVVSALAVGVADQDQAKLESIFRAHGWQLGKAHTRVEARAILASSPVRVVIAESDLPGCGWMGILEEVRQMPNPPVLVVTARLADEALWAEVLNMGGYDVLAKPLDGEEVARVVGAAIRRFDNERHGQRRPMPLAPLTQAAGIA